MTSRVISVADLSHEAQAAGATVRVDGQYFVVLHVLPRLPGRRPAMRVSGDVPCGTCDAPLRYDRRRGGWRCPKCDTAYDRQAIEDLVTEHVEDGVRAGRNRRTHARKARRVARWRRECGIEPAAVPKVQQYESAMAAGEHGRAELLARIALATPGLTSDQRVQWRERRDDARGEVERRL